MDQMSLALWVLRERFGRIKDFEDRQAEEWLRLRSRLYPGRVTEVGWSTSVGDGPKYRDEWPKP